jgi:hypothetical protein|tara:strand:- start:12304 stop:12459 length:156 start_codon:yes stop_codon:yes gene_type:complete
MTKLESIKNINRIKLNAIKKGGYKKHYTAIKDACAKHFEQFGSDHMPLQLK